MLNFNILKGKHKKNALLEWKMSVSITGFPSIDCRNYGQPVFIGFDRTANTLC